jgi:glutamate synthase (NADPH/NADH) small chain
MENELEKCLLCVKPLCTACPAGTDIRRVIELVRAGKPFEAGMILFDNNPLTAITGSVCPNHLFCKGACVLSKKGVAPDFGVIEREVSRGYLDSAERPFTSVQGDNGKKVLIVGSGPAGIALAYYMRKAGYHVEVWEKEPKFGGMLRYGIPNFRLDKGLIDKTINVIAKMGVVFRADVKVDLNDLPSGFDMVVLCIGAGVSRKLNIEGEEYAVGALEYLKNPTTGDSVVVIGAGNVAIDCALTAIETGARSVNLCYRKDETAMKAYPEELAHARGKGVVFNYFHVPTEIDEARVWFDVGAQEEYPYPADKVIVAIGQGAVDLDAGLDLEVTSQGLIMVDEGFKTNIPNVYAIGDAVTGTRTIIQAVAAANVTVGFLMVHL